MPGQHRLFPGNFNQFSGVFMTEKPVYRFPGFPGCVGTLVSAAVSRPAEIKTGETKEHTPPAPWCCVMVHYHHVMPELSLKAQQFTLMDKWITHLAKKSEYSLLVSVNYPFNRSFAQAELSPSSVDLMQMIHAYLNALNKHKGCLQQYLSVGQYRFI